MKRAPRVLGIGARLMLVSLLATCKTGETTAPTPPAVKLSFSVQPSSVVAGASVSPAVKVTIQDAQGNTVTSSTASVTLAVTSGTGAVGAALNGTLTQTAAGGVATFSNLSLDKVGTGYTLTATSSGLTGATSAAFDVSAGAAAKLAFGTQPTNTVAGATISSVSVAVTDAAGNTVTTATNSITMAIGTNPAGGTLSGTTVVAASGGTAGFSTLKIEKAGTGYTLTASATGLTSATSNAFNITPGGNTGTTYVGTQSPGDVWSWTLNSAASTFSATNLTKNYTYSGTMSQLPSGFLKLVVASTTDPGVTTPATAYAVELPQTALLVQPVGPYDPMTISFVTQLIVAGAQGACPTSGAKYNLVEVPTGTFSTATSPSYATATGTVAGGLLSWTASSFKLNGTATGTDSQSGFACSQGLFTKPGNPTTVALTPSGVFFVDNGGAGGGVSGAVGVAAPAANLDLAQIGTSSYRGFIFYHKNGSPRTNPAIAFAGAAGDSIKTCTYDNVETNAVSTNCGRFIVNSQLSPGLVTATNREPPGGYSPYVVAITQINGKYIFFGAGQAGGSTDGTLFMMLQQ